MSLENKVEKVKKFGENSIVVDLTDGYSIAYEKQKTINGEGIFYSVADLENRLYQDAYDIEDDKSGRYSFSKKFAEVFKNYKCSASKRLDASDKKITDYSNKILSPLDIKVDKYRLWNHPMNWLIMGGLSVAWSALVPLGLCASALEKVLPKWASPILIPFVPLYLIAPNHNPANFIKAPYPFIFLQMMYYQAKELFVPSGRCFRVFNEDLLKNSPDSGDGRVLFWHDWESGSTPKPSEHKKFDRCNIMFQDGFAVKHDYRAYDKKVAFLVKDVNREYGMYLERNKKYFISVDAKLKQDLYDALVEQENEHENFNAFCKSLKKEVHVNLLKSIGFI